MARNGQMYFLGRIFTFLHWIHKRYSVIKGSLANRTDFQCKRCKGIARPIDGRPTTNISVEESELEVVYEFCYLEDMIKEGIHSQNKSSMGKV